MPSERIAQSLLDACARLRARNFEQRTPMRFLDWAEEHFYLSADATNTKGMRWRTHGYQRAIMHVFADLDIPTVVLMKPAQVGATQILKAITGYEVAHRYRTVGMWLPRDADLNDFSTLQIGSLLRDCPEVGDQLRVEVGKKDSDNTTKRRAFLAAQWFGRASNTPANFMSISVETALLDEVNRMPRTIRMTKDEHGTSPMSLVDGRMDAARFRKKIITSTAGEVGASNVADELDQCREVFQQHHECPHCGESQILEWGDRDTGHGFKWHRVEGDDGQRDNFETSRTVWYQCNQGCQIHYADMPDMDDNHSEWRSENLRICNDTGNFYLLEGGEEVEKPNSVGFKLTGFVSRTKSWQLGLMEFLRATDKAKAGDMADLIKWTQEYKGVDYEADDKIETVRHGYLMTRAEEYEAECPDGVQAITGWWDVQKDRIEGWYVGWGFGEELWGLQYFIEFGDPTNSGVLDKIGRMCDQTFRKASGAEVPVAITGVDCGYQPDAVYDLSRRFGIDKIIPTRGQGEIGKPIVEVPRRPHPVHRVYRTPMGINAAKDVIYNRYTVETPGPGYVHTPLGRGHDEEFYKGLVVEQKKLKNGVRRWICPDGARNEPLDCFVGNLALLRILQQRYSLVLRSREEHAEIEVQPVKTMNARERAQARAAAYRRK